MLKVSSFWRGFSWSTKLDKTYTSEEPSSLLCHVTLANTYLKYSYTQMCRWVGIFQKSYDPIVMTLLVTGEECYLDFSSWSCTYPTLVSIEPLEVKIISIFLYKNDNCPTLFWAFIIDNSSFLTTVTQKCSMYPYFQQKSFWFMNSNCFPFWRGCAVCLAHLIFIILYLSHRDVTAWHKPDRLNSCNIYA